MESAQPRRRYIGGFDGLRTIGVIGVILYHLRPDLFQGGYLGVLLFFVISGYLITDGFVRQYDREGGIKLGQFFGKRIRRLYPALLTVLLGASAYIGLFARDLLVNLHKIVLSNLALVYNWWQIANGQSYFERFAHNESPFVHLWTLSIEGQYYIIWPFLFIALMKLLKTNGKRFAATMVLALASGVWMLALYRLTMLGGGDPSRLYYGTDTRIFALLMGSALAFVWPSQKLAATLPRPSRILLDGVGTIAVLAMGASLMNLSDQSSALYEGGMVGFALMALALVAVVASPATRWGKLLSNPVFHWVGTRSYGIYIYQFPVMIFFENAFRNVAGHPVLYPVIEVAIILVISELSYRFIEQPAAHVTKAQLQAFGQKLRHGGAGAFFARLGVVLVAVIAMLGIAGVAQAPFAKVAVSPEERHLKANQETKAQKKAALEKAKKALQAQKKADAASKKASQSSSQATSESTKFAHPVNQNYEAYGISQAQLQQAQTTLVSAIGDSVLLDAKPDLQQLMPKAFIDGKVARQMGDSVALVKSYADQGALADNVIIELGTNGPFSTSQMDAMMQAIGPNRHVFWVNAQVPTRPWQNSVNAMLQAGTKRFANLTVIDWHGYADGHRDWFYDDQVHPNPNGNKYYAAYITKNVVAHAKQ